MSAFRGQYMDMVHPSSDVKVADKPNLAGQQSIKTLSPFTPREETLIDAVEKTDTYESPFLSNVEVEKRPLGGLPVDNTNDARDTFDINEFVDLSKPELPADDSGRGELEPELPVGEEIVIEEPENEVSPTFSDEIEPEPALEPEPELKSELETELESEPESEKPIAPFAHAAEPITKPKTKKSSSIWIWIVLFILIAIVGAAAGALIYLMGWLG